MNKHHLKYMLEDTKQGLKRNRSSSIASAVLLCIALCLIGVVLLTRMFLSDTIDYIESQLAMKVYVEEGLVEQIADILQEQSYVTSVEIETGEEMINGLAFFFKGKEHLLEAFTDGSVEDAVKFQIKDESLMSMIAENLEQINGITKVIYPQRMAEMLASWLTKIEVYGTLAIVIFFVLAFVMVYITFHLASYQRNRELKVKLYLGMNPNLVRMQFLLEGLVLGLLGGIVAIGLIVVMYNIVFVKIQQEIPYIGQVSATEVFIVVCIQFVVAVAISLLASHFSTRKLINDV